MNIQKTHPKSFIVRAHSTSTALKSLCEMYPLKNTDQKYGEKDIVILQMVEDADNWFFIEMVLKSDYEDQRNPDELELKIESLEKEIKKYKIQLSNKDFMIESLNQGMKNLLDQMNAVSDNTESQVA